MLLSFTLINFNFNTTTAHLKKYYKDAPNDSHHLVRKALVACYMSMAARTTEVTGLHRSAIEEHLGRDGIAFFKIIFQRAKAIGFKTDSGHCLCILGDLETAALRDYLKVFDACEQDKNTRLWRKMRGDAAHLKIGKQPIDTGLRFKTTTRDRRGIFGEQGVFFSLSERRQLFS